ncbi:MAG TPA: aminopeptidase [Kofleriaceae bacterium]|nr:aminopeptidase [Kofleriaceae bacterium]
MRLALAAAAALLAGGCLMPRYLSQAVRGQLDLLQRARPIDQVIADPETPARTRVLLGEIAGIRAFAGHEGLRTGKNYRTYVEVAPEATVWFVGAADPLSFTPRRWCFPVAGCFTGLGWFDQDDAIHHRDQLLRAGYDAMARPAGAYSTGGWFHDPITSSMLDDGPDAFAELANVVLHESVHATVLIPDQPYFNEGLAEYVGDTLTGLWLAERFGPDAPELAAWQEVQAWQRTRMARLFSAYEELDELYKSTKSKADKLAAKKQIIDRLVADLDLWTRPNNANLVELRVYKASYDAFAKVREACGGDVRKLMKVAGTLKRGDFPAPVTEDLSPVLTIMEARCRA